MKESDEPRERIDQTVTPAAWERVEQRQLKGAEPHRTGKMWQGWPALDPPKVHSDEPRDVPWLVGVDARVAPEKAAVLAAVLAEVARQDAGEWREDTSAEIRRAAVAIRDAIRLCREGA